MKSFKDLEKNWVLLVEIFFYLILLAVNCFFGLEIYEKVLGDASMASTVTMPADFKELTSLDTKVLENFEDDQENKKFYIKGVDEEYTDEWSKFTNPSSPF